jgi:dynein heavy chain
LFYQTNVLQSFSCRDNIDDQVWRFLLTGGVALENPYPNPCPDWLIDKAWSEIVRASDLTNLKGLKDGKLSAILNS